MPEPTKKPRAVALQASFRHALPDDYASIAGIWNGVIRDTVLTFNSVEKTPAELAALIAERIASGHPFHVAEQEGEVCGFAFYLQFRAGLGYQHTMEHTIHLSRVARGRGLGRTLLTALEEQAAQRGVHVMIAGISGENPGGRAFHRALGYHEAAVLPQVGRKFGRWLDLHLMHKCLVDAGSLRAGVAR